MTLSEVFKVQLPKDLHNIRIFFFHTDADLLFHTFRKKLVIYFLHNHITGIQPVFWLIFFAFIKNLSAFFQSAEASGKCGFTSSVISDNAYGTPGWYFAIRNIKDPGRFFVGKLKIQKFYAAGSFFRGWNEIQTFQIPASKSFALTFFFCKLFKLFGRIILVDPAFFHIKNTVCQSTEIIKSVFGDHNCFALLFPGRNR